MVDQDKPRVKLSDAIPRKPVVPGPNSWAQSQQEQQQRSSSGELSLVGRVTNRDKYEQKPMPPPPADAPPHNKHLLAKTYIQPAIPLVNPAPEMQSQQKRAVTDPVTPKPLFAGRKLSVAKLRKKYSFSKAKDDVPEAKAMPTNQPSPVVRLSSEKAAEVSGLYLPPMNRPSTPPTSAPVAPVPDPFRLSPDSIERTTSPAWQVQSTPAPTRRFLRENDLPTPAITGAPIAPHRQVNDDPQSQKTGPKRIENDMLTPGMLQPPRLGKHGNVGEVGLVEANGMHRVESFSGVIEYAGSSLGHNEQMYAGSTGAPSQSSMTQGLNTGDLLPPLIYSPSNYDGVWENDPAVGYSLPPFSPMPNRLAPNNEPSRDGLFDNHSMPIVSNKFINDHGNNNYTDLPPGTHFSANINPNPNPNTELSSNYHHPFPSANSWVSGNSFTSNNAPVSALVSPGWLNHHSNNSVPSPPHNQHDYQRPGSVSAAIARLELTVHHHIDSITGLLSRLITDKHDRIMDQTIGRLENLEEIVSKGFRDLKVDLKDTRKDIGIVKGDLKDVVKSSGRVQDIYAALDGKLESLEKAVEEHSCKCQLATTEESPHMLESERQCGAVSHRRTESAHEALGQGEQRHQYQSGTSRSSNSARHSGNSNRARRSNTSNSRPCNRMSDDLDIRREYFAELGAARGPMPDLRDHPAYSGMQQTQGQTYNHDQNTMPSISNGLPYEHPSLSDGRWYQQAYGPNQ